MTGWSWQRPRGRCAYAASDLSAISTPSPRGAPITKLASVRLIIGGLRLGLTGGSLLFSSPPIKRRSARQRITKKSCSQALLRSQLVPAITFL
jgi:hypothetical protein